MAKILYLTSKSIYTCAAQGTLLDIIKKQKENGHDVAVLLIQDSTLACWKGAKNIISEAATHGIDIFAIKEDLEARGIIDDKVHPDIKQVNYEQAISVIMDKYEKVITWC
ncbi:MAG TPA: sulfurtransferase complex subunit TusB [candidate division Zixibacteria bacterium]|nr:sulfurtransferase complex subunit TusB [candidate division Zixibacteria bacterium]